MSEPFSDFNAFSLPEPLRAERWILAVALGDQCGARAANGLATSHRPIRPRGRAFGHSAIGLATDQYMPRRGLVLKEDDSLSADLSDHFSGKLNKAKTLVAGQHDIGGCLRRDKDNRSGIRAGSAFKRNQPAQGPLGD
jgi:hypothetical protein